MEPREGGASDETIDLLRELLDRPISFHRILAKVSGGATVGLFLSHAFYWSRRTDNPEGWFWKTQEEWEEETSLTRREQETARARLKALGILQEKRAGVPAKLYFRLDLDRLFSLLQGVTDKNVRKRHTESPARQYGEKRQSRLAERDEQARRKAPARRGGNARSLIGTETTTKITQRLQQQHASTPNVGATLTTQGVVVVDPADIVRLLTDRGITAVVARRLIERIPSATITRQVEYFDWERAAAPDDPKLTAGRLRRRIEEDWTPPAMFVSSAECEHQATTSANEAALEQRRRDVAREEEQRRRATADAEEAALLASLGLHVEDQMAWRALVESPRRLPTAFREALFYAPREGEPPAVIFRQRGTLEQVTGAAYALHRAEIERRLRERFPQYARSVRPVAYLAYDDVAAALHTSPTAPEDERPIGQIRQPAG